MSSSDLPSPRTPQTLQRPPSPSLSYLSSHRPYQQTPADEHAGARQHLTPSRLTRGRTSNDREQTELVRDHELAEGDELFKKSIQIDMKSRAGDSVGNMSISPTKRDIVLAVRRGLSIIDLEAPHKVPRSLPQGGTWDVADVQWNPHPSHAEYIVSTCSERMLIWNIAIFGKNAIEFILRSHYRAITDVNWHTSDPDIVCSTGIDSWIWAWDIRTPQKPIFGISAFNAGGTQVKWNRKDGNVLASSHLDEVLFWDRRKGSVPFSRIKAHDGKIYGIDWSHSRREEIITCSLDKTIKVWDMKALVSPQPEPSATYFTENPVWRARDLPFANGFLSVPQRGEAVVELWNYADLRGPVERFEGHSDVVKEFVWRSRDGQNCDDKSYQLITWSKDKTLRFWPISNDVMQKVDSEQNSSADQRSSDTPVGENSYRDEPSGAADIPALSAPRGHRSIFKSVRAAPPIVPHQGSVARGTRLDNLKDKDPTFPNSAQHLRAAYASDRHDGTMSKGSTKGAKGAPEAAMWLSNFISQSMPRSRFSSGSRPASALDYRGPHDSQHKRSPSRDRHDDAPRDPELTSAALLLDEINAVGNKLTAAKVKLERHGLTKSRTCTFGLHGPWGESSTINVFVRVSFNFPKEYPHAKHPYGTPSIEIERSPYISVKRRAFMKKRLREIRETQRPCLEACLRFLLFADGARKGQGPTLDLGSDSEEDAHTQEDKEQSASLVPIQPNLAEPRSSQGVFGPNGQLVCIFRSLPRVVKPVPQDLSAIPAQEAETVQRLFRSPLQLSDAVRRLDEAANDHSYYCFSPGDPEDNENILRIMNNLLSYSQSKPVLPKSARSPEGMQNDHSHHPKRMTIVYIKDRSSVVGAHRALAADYVTLLENPLDFCRTNSEIARRHLRDDHARVFGSLAALFEGLFESKKNSRRHEVLPQKPPDIIIEAMHSALLEMKDLQLLAMFAVLVLRLRANISYLAKAVSSSSVPPTPQQTDYFNLRFRHGAPVASPMALSRQPSSPSSPVAVPGQSLGSSGSSRGSWSSIFNTGPVRHLIGAANEQTTTKHSYSPVEKPSLVPFQRGKRIVLSRSSEPRSGRSLSRNTTSVFATSRTQLIRHVLGYAEMLHAWKLTQKRAELLKSASIDDHSFALSGQGLELNTLCQKCSKLLKDCHCPMTSTYATRTLLECVVCRSIVKGLSHCCIVCCHTSHLKCWKAQQFLSCPSGCGCECS